MDFVLDSNLVISDWLNPTQLWRRQHLCSQWEDLNLPWSLCCLLCWHAELSHPADTRLQHVHHAFSKRRDCDHVMLTFRCYYSTCQLSEGFLLHCSCAGIKNQLPVFHHEVEIKDMTVKSDTKQRKVSYSKLRICFDGIYGQNTQGLSVTDSHIRSLSSFYSTFKVTYEVNEDTWRFHMSP